MTDPKTPPRIFLPPAEVSQDVVKQLRAVPWCSALLDDANFHSVFSSARVKHDDGEDSLLSTSLNSETTIPLWQAFYRPYSAGPPKVQAEIRVVARLGSGLNGHAGIGHGGFIALMLDEVVSTMAAKHVEPGKTTFTVSLHVNYKKPLPMPGLVLVRAVENPKTAGRKFWVDGSVEDGNGVVYATAEALMLEARL